jgi:hypothetical protein
MPLQAVAQFGSCAEQPGFRGADRDAKFGSYVRHRSVLDVAQKKNAPQQGRDAPNLSFQNGAHLQLSKLSFRIRRFVG